MPLTKYLRQEYDLELPPNVIAFLKEIELKTVGDLGYLDEEDFATIITMMKKIPAAKFVRAWKDLYEQEQPQQSVQAPKQGSYANAATAPAAPAAYHRAAAPAADRRAVAPAAAPANRRAGNDQRKKYRQANTRNHEICYHHTQGTCTHGDMCNKPHSEDEVGNTMEVEKRINPPLYAKLLESKSNCTYETVACWHADSRRECPFGWLCSYEHTEN